MPAGVCGKRSLGLSETLGSSSPASTSPKRFRRSPPVVQQSSEDNNNILHLMRMFPSMDREQVESVVNAHSHKVDDAIRYLNAICLGEVRPENETENSDSKVAADGSEIAGTGLSELTVEQPQEHNAPLASRSSTDMSLLIEECVEEMMNATDMDDFRARAPRILDIFARSVASCSRDVSEQQQQLVPLKELLQRLSRQNQILKKAVVIQHGRREQEHQEKTREVQQLKHLLNQYQQQLHNLEFQNYTLKAHLQRAQEWSSIPDRFHPDVF